jgi:hypothetical protein
MRITAIETIHLSRGITVHAGPIRWLWVRIHTDTGLVGLGETYPRPEAEAAIVHRALAPVLLGRDPAAIDRLWADMFQAVSYSGWAGAEMRAISSVDISLWDLAGKDAGAPVYQLLGGASRSSIRTYNTCYDHVDFLTEPVKLARELSRSGIRAMKIWPFDGVARETGGQFITAAQMRQGIEPLRLIREEFGDSMDVAMEFHGYWSLPCAIQIAHALEPYAPMWLEEMLPQDNLAAYAETGARHAPAALPQRASDDALGISRAHRKSSGTDHHAGHQLVWRDLGGEEDRDHGRVVLSAGGAAQLRRAGAARGVRASGCESNEPAHSGNRAAALSGGVSWHCDEYAGGSGWRSAVAAGAGFGCGSGACGARAGRRSGGTERCLV